MNFLLKRVHIAVEALLEAGAAPPAPPLLFHYTGAAGVKGILADDTLWFGDAFFLNDASETNYGFAMLEEAVAEWARDKSTWQQALGQAILKKAFDSSLASRSAAFCMSDNGNLLNQWRDYGKEAVAYAIGFDPHALRMAVDTGPEGTMLLLRMIYDVGVQQTLITAVVTQTLDAACQEPGSKDMESDDGIALVSDATLPLHVATMALKHPDFEAEREWRLCATVNLIGSSQRFRTTPVGIAPYYEMKPKTKGAKLPVHKVMVGPSPHGFVAEMGVKLLLKSSGHDVDEVITDHSGIPLRY